MIHVSEAVVQRLYLLGKYTFKEYQPVALESGSDGQPAEMKTYFLEMKVRTIIEWHCLFG
jgi:hypothetical protein